MLGILQGGLAVLVAAIGAGQTPAPTPAPATPDAPRVSEQITVTAERAVKERGVTPAAVSVLTREEIERIPAETLAELLEALPGLQTLFADRSSGTLPMISARGFFGGGEAEYVQLRVDGVPGGDAESGLADWRSIRASDIERIELLRGPGSSLYGDTALAGVVQIFTRAPRPGESGGRAEIAAGSFGSAGADARWSRSDAGWSLEGAGGAFRTDGFRAHSAAEELEGRITARRSAGKSAWSFRAEGRSTAREEPGALSRRDRESRPEASDPVFSLDREEGERARASAAYRYEGTMSVHASLSGGSRKSDFVRTLLLAPGLGDRALKELSSGHVSASIEAEAASSWLRRGRLLAGGELAREWLHTTYRPVAEDGAAGARSGSARGIRDRLGLFLLQELNASRRVRATAGTRFDLLEEDFGSSASRRQAWSPRVGLNVRMGPLDRSPTSVFVVASRAFKAPTLDQLYDPRPLPDFQGGTFQLSNATLRPQRAWNLELGVFREMPGARLDLSCYWMQVEDEIDFDPASLRYLNIGDSLHEGVEASARIRLGKPFWTSVSYAWTRAEPRHGEHRGRLLKNIPEHMARAALEAALPGALRASLSWSFMAGRYLDDANAFPLDDASTVDLRLERDAGRWTIRLDVLNLADAEFPQLGFILPGFDGSAALYEYPAPGLSARAGLEWRF